MPAPSDAEQAAQLKIIKRLFESQYKDLTPAGLHQLATDLLQESDLIEKNYVARFVLLMEAKTAALQRGELPLFQRALEGIHKYYEFDLTPIVLDALPKFLAKDPNDDAPLALGLEVAEWDIERDDYDSSNAILKVLTPRSAMSKDDQLRTRFKNCLEAPLEYKAAQAALATLRSVPTDSNANLIVGKFFCFRKKNWSLGLPLLAKGSDSRLRAPAAADVAQPKDPVARCNVGGMWWALADDPDFAKVKSLLKWRAGYWYSRSIGELRRLTDLAVEREGDFRPRVFKFEIQANVPGTATIGVEKGRRIKIESKGMWSRAGEEHIVPVSKDPPRAKIGDGPWFQTAAEGTTFVADRSGPLFLRLEDGDELRFYLDNVGSATCTITVYPPEEAP